MATSISSQPSIRALSLKYLYGGVVHYRPGDRVLPRVLPDYELVMMIEGQATYRKDDHDQAAGPGTLILARPGFHESYIWDVQFPTRHAYIHFDISAMPEDWPALKDWPVLDRQPNPVLAPMFRHLIENIANHPEWPVTSPNAEVCRFLECLLHIILRPTKNRASTLSHHLPEPVHHALKLMRSIIDEGSHQRVSLADLARKAGVTEKHLCRLFQSALGHAPMQTFRLLKLQLAIALLNRSHLSIKEIAHRCGFENPLYFSRCFTQTYGSSPRKIRHSLRAHQAPPPNPLPPEITPRIFW